MFVYTVSVYICINFSLLKFKKRTRRKSMSIKIVGDIFLFCIKVYIILLTLLYVTNLHTLCFTVVLLFIGHYFQNNKSWYNVRLVPIIII